MQTWVGCCGESDGRANVRARQRRRRPVHMPRWHHHQRLPTLRSQRHVPRKQRTKYQHGRRRHRSTKRQQEINKYMHVMYCMSCMYLRMHTGAFVQGSLRAFVQEKQETTKNKTALFFNTKIIVRVCTSSKYTTATAAD